MTQALLDRALDLRRLGERQRHEPDTDGGVAAYEQAIALFREVGDPLRLAHALRHLGDIHFEQGRRDLAAPFVEEALALYRAAQPAAPPLDLANALRTAALLNGPQSGELWAEARELYAREGVGAGVEECERGLERCRQ